MTTQRTSSLRNSWQGLPRRAVYPLVAAGLAIGAPFGYFLLQCLLTGVMPAATVWAAELDRDPVAYAYLLISTTAVFATVGYVVGRKQDRTSREALTDVLTGLANRRGIQARIDRVLARATAERPLALLLIDVDRLKTINDENGHKGGDAALRAVASAIRAVSRETDLAARFGGDEFVLLAPEISRAEANDLAQRIGQKLRVTSIPGFRLPVSVSVGVACSQGGTSQEDLLLLADRALYRAKEEGRNRVVIAENVVPNARAIG